MWILCDIGNVIMGFSKSLVYDSWFDKSHTQFPSSQYSLSTVLYKWGHATSMKGSFGCSNNIDGLCRKWPKNGFQNNSIMVSFICSLLLNIERSPTSYIHIKKTRKTFFTVVNPCCVNLKLFKNFAADFQANPTDISYKIFEQFQIHTTWVDNSHKTWK